MLLLVLVSLICHCSAGIYQEDFSGHQVLRLHPTTSKQLKYLKSIERKYNELLDFWTHPSAVNRNVDIHVTKTDLNWMKELLQDEGIQQTVLIEDLQRVVDQQLQDMATFRKKRSADLESSNLESSNNYILNNFASHIDINNWLENVSSSCGVNCTTYDIGNTGEGRPIKVIKISSDRNDKSSKKAIWIEAGIHGREWISPVTANNIIYNLITEYSSDRCVRHIVDAFDWYILPVANPDGYEYSRSRNRMWRKNRRMSEVARRPWWSIYYHQSYQSYNHQRCYGVDLNRNFGFKWGETGTSTNPCSDIYGGPEAFSEPETVAIRNFTTEIHNRTEILAYLSLHAYGQLWLYSWGYTRQRPRDHELLKRIANEGMEAIFLASNKKTQYTVGAAARTLYASSGASDDWAKGSLGVKYSFTLELPPSDANNQLNGFLLPTSAIPAISRETWSGIKAMAEISLKIHERSGTRVRHNFCSSISRNSSNRIVAV